MSKISTVYDTLLAELVALFPDKTQIPNAYAIAENSEIFLRDGWGISVGASNRQPHEFKTLHRERVFTVLLSREVIRTESNADAWNAEVKALLEDINTLYVRIENVDQLDIPDEIEDMLSSVESGVQFVLGEKSDFIYSEAELIVKVRENL